MFSIWVVLRYDLRRLECGSDPHTVPHSPVSSWSGFGVVHRGPAEEGLPRGIKLILTPHERAALRVRVAFALDLVQALV